MYTHFPILSPLSSSTFTCNKYSHVFSLAFCFYFVAKKENFPTYFAYVKKRLKVLLFLQDLIHIAPPSKQEKERLRWWFGCWPIFTCSQYRLFTWFPLKQKRTSSVYSGWFFKIYLCVLWFGYASGNEQYLPSAVHPKLWRKKSKFTAT